MCLRNCIVIVLVLELFLIWKSNKSTKLTGKSLKWHSTRGVPFCQQLTNWWNLKEKQETKKKNNLSFLMIPHSLPSSNKSQNSKNTACCCCLHVWKKCFLTASFPLWTRIKRNNEINKDNLFSFFCLLVSFFCLLLVLRYFW